jgi:hypothetical protein
MTTSTHTDLMTGLFAIVVGWKLKGPDPPSLEAPGGKVGERGPSPKAMDSLISDRPPESEPLFSLPGERAFGSCGISAASIRTGESSGGGVGVRGGCGIGRVEAIMEASRKFTGTAYPS